MEIEMLTEKEKRMAVELLMAKQREDEEFERNAGVAYDGTEKPHKKGLEVTAKVRLTEYGSVQLTFYLPQNYLRKVMKLEKLAKDDLPKGKPWKKY